MKKIILDEVLGRERKLHWKYYGFDEKVERVNKDGQKITDFIYPTEITVNHLKSEEEALAQVKRTLKRKYFYLKETWECTQCQTQEEQMAILKMARKHLEE